MKKFKVRENGLVADFYCDESDLPRKAIIMLGGSEGAEADLLLATKSSQVKAVVALSPASVIWQGIPKKRFDIVKVPKSSWSYRGKDLPFLQYPESIKKIATLLTLRFRRAHEEALRNIARVKEAAIPVEKSRGAILLISAKRDRIWPSTIMGEMITSRLTRKGYLGYCRHIPFNTSHNGLIMKKDC